MPDLSPLRLLLLAFGGWVNRRQARVLEYLVEERGAATEHGTSPNDANGLPYRSR